MNGSNRGIILRYYLGICMEGLKKPRKTSFRIACLQAETWSRDITNSKQECNRSNTTFHNNCISKYVEFVDVGFKMENIKVWITISLHLSSCKDLKLMAIYYNDKFIYNYTGPINTYCRKNQYIIKVLNY
jgi:hypothetical protein